MEKTSKKGFFLGSCLALFFGGVLIWIWFQIVDNPFNEYALMTKGVSVPVKIGECSLESDENEEGDVGFYNLCKYSYVAEGQNFEDTTDDLTEGENAEVVYLPGQPSVHMLKEKI